MSNLKKQILDLLNTAEELIAEAPQTIQVRGALKYLKQVQGSITSATFETLDGARVAVKADLNPVAETEVVEEVSEGSIETASDQGAEILEEKDLLT
tara:strand:- start:8018 stop:8308 length:291 start_codon:yes stop_codon:yes gene_type:complete